MMTEHVRLPVLFNGWRYGYALFLMPMRGLDVAEHAGSMVGVAAPVRTLLASGSAVIVLRAPRLQRVGLPMRRWRRCCA